jgi:hypothetical protein
MIMNFDETNTTLENLKQKFKQLEEKYPRKKDQPDHPDYVLIRKEFVELHYKRIKLNQENLENNHANSNIK